MSWDVATHNLTSSLGKGWNIEEQEASTLHFLLTALKEITHLPLHVWVAWCGEDRNWVKQLTFLKIQIRRCLFRSHLPFEERKRIAVEPCARIKNFSPEAY